MKWMTKLTPKLIVVLLPLIVASAVPGAAQITMPAAMVTATTSGIAVSEIIIMVVAPSKR